MAKNPDVSLYTELTDIQRHVTQNAGTEPPFSGKLLHNKKKWRVSLSVLWAAVIYVQY